MSDEYTPSTEEVREQYWAASGTGTRDPRVWAEFDRWLAQHEAAIRAEALGGALQAHRNLHPTYGSTAGCGGGIGGQVMTQHCAVVCDNPAHDKAREAWYLVERAYFEREHLAAPEVTVEDVARVLGSEQTDRGEEAPRFSGRMLHPSQAREIAEYLHTRWSITERKAE